MSRNKSDTNKEARYIKVPLPIFRLLIEDKRKISDVINYGICLTSMGQEISEYNAVLQLLYAYFNQGSNNERVPLTKSLKEKLEYLDEELSLSDEDYRGFSPSNSGQFAPESGLDDTVTVILNKLKDDEDFKDEIFEFHILRQVAELFNLQNIDVDGMRRIHLRYQTFDNYPIYAFANIDIMYKYLNDIDQKTDDDIACLLMYMAYKSIIGEKKIVRASNSMVLARMVGAKGRDKLEGILAKHPHAKKFYERYSQKEHFNRIKGMVTKYKFIPRINSIPGKAGLGTFVSCDHNISDKEFAENIKKFVDDERKKKNRERVARYRAKYNLDNDDTGKYLAELFGSSPDNKGLDETTDIPSGLPF